MTLDAGRNPVAAAPVRSGEGRSDPTTPHRRAPRHASERGTTPTPRGRVCRRCKRHKSAAAFPLWDHPITKARGYATRHWCDSCLEDGGHHVPEPPKVTLVPVPQYHAPLPVPGRPPAAPDGPITERERAGAVDRIAEHTIATVLFDQAAAEPRFERALLRAAEMLLVSQGLDTRNPSP